MQLDESAHGQDSREVAGSLCNLINLVNKRGNPAEARRLGERALSIAEKTYGPEHSQTASILHNLARVLCDLEEFAEARKHAERYLRIVEADDGSNSIRMAVGLLTLGQIMRLQGKPDEAWSLLQRAFADL